MSRNKAREAFRKIHLWLGLSSGLIIFLVCLSGTIYTFRTEIERWSEPGKYYLTYTAAEKLQSADDIIKGVEQKLSAKVVSVMVPADAGMSWQVGVKKGNDKSRPKTYFINPFTGSIIGEQGGSTSEFFTSVMQMHRWLMLDESTGRIIVGIATLIMFFMVFTGLILWFPARLRNLKKGLKIKTAANWKRINHDLHSVLGFYAFSILLVMTLTGLCWSFEWYRNGLSNVLGAKVFRGRTEKPLVSSQKPGEAASMADMIGKTTALFPYPGNSRLSIPEDPTAAITVTKGASGFFSVGGTDKVQFDRFSGEVLKTERFSEKPLNVQIADSIRLIHTGEIFGTASKILYFLACLIATSLPVTGTLIWLNKMSKKKKKSSATTAVKQPEFV